MPHGETPDQEHEFRSSTPDLRQSVWGTDNETPENLYQIETNEAIALEHREHAEQKIRETEQAIEILERLTTSSPLANDPDSRGDVSIGLEGLKRSLAKQQSDLRFDIKHKGEVHQILDRQEANLWHASQNLRRNEEIYKQEAVDEAREQGIDIDYLPYTGGQEEPPPSSEVHGQE